MTTRQEHLTAARAEGDAVLELLRGLTDEEWQKPTDCPDWTVRDIAAHLVGQGESTARPWIVPRRMRTGARRFPGRSRLDAYTAQQVAEHAGQTGPQLTEAFGEQWRTAVTAMRRTPGAIRRISVDSGVPGIPRITIGHLYDDILPRDLWMHRVDIARATGRPVPYDPCDAQIVAGVIDELADAWAGPPVRLELTGPAGGTWSLGRADTGDGDGTGNGAGDRTGDTTGDGAGDATADGAGDRGGDRAVAPTVRADTVEYMRLLSGRPAPAGQVLNGGDQAVRDALSAVRILF